MPSLVAFAFLTTMIGIAVPPLLFVAALLWVLVYRKGSRNVARVRDKRVAKTLKHQQHTYDKAVRFFQ